jgi:hypothetical protein
MPNQMMPVYQQLAGPRIAVLNAFITNIPNQMMPVDQKVAGCRECRSQCIYYKYPESDDAG